MESTGTLVSWCNDIVSRNDQSNQSNISPKRTQTKLDNNGRHKLTYIYFEQQQQNQPTTTK